MWKIVNKFKGENMEAGANSENLGIANFLISIMRFVSKKMSRIDYGSFILK